MVDGKFEHRGIDLGHVAVADVAHRVGADPVGDDVHRLHCQGKIFLRPGVDRRLIYLDVLRAGVLQIHDLLMNRAGELQDEFPAGRIVLVERPLRNRVWPGQHAFDRPAGERLRVLEPLHGNRVAAPYRPNHHRFGIIPVPVGADETGDGEPFHLIGEIGHHVPAVLLAVHQQVHAGVFLDLNPLPRRAPFQLCEFILGEVFPGKLAPRLDE